MAKLGDVWNAEQLMGGVPPEQDSKGKGKGVDADPMLWGVPGHLTKAETDIFFQFRAEVERRGEDFRSTVYCFGEEEGEAWALCRWLRARKFVLSDVIKMVEEASETRKEAKDKDFYPDPIDALGVEASLFFAQYPQLYSGVAKNGAVIFISKPGILNVDGMECITTLDGILKFHWHIMMHDFANRLRAQKAKNPDFKKYVCSCVKKYRANLMFQRVSNLVLHNPLFPLSTRFECFCVLDLNNLTTSQLSRRAMAIIKEQTAIDSVCFPETMSKMLIVNAPTFFSATWRLIKGWLDPRTANKIEVISSKNAVEKRLLELVDRDQLPEDYGGQGPNTNKTLMEEFGGSADRMSTKMLYLRYVCAYWFG